MKVKPFGIIPAIATLVLSVGLVNHVLVVPILLAEAKRDSWMSVIVSLAVVLPWAAIPLFGLLKKLNGVRFDIWLSDRVHPVIRWIIMSYLLLVLFMIAVEALIVTSSWTGTTYLPNTPTVIIAAVFLGLSLYAAHMGLRTIAFMSCLLIPMVLFLGDFVMVTNMPNKDYRYLLPFFEYGLSPVVKASINCLTAFSELFVLLLIQHHFKARLKLWHLVALVLFLALLAIGPLTGALSQFGPEEARKLKYPAFSQWRLVTVGRYFEHVDFFAIFQWLSGSLIRLSLSLYVLLEYFPIPRKKKKWIAPAVLGAVMVSLAYYWTDHMIFYRVVVKYWFHYMGMTTMAVIAIVFGISFLNKKRREQHERQNGSRETKKQYA
ncbi:endospore germination permease [Paenibacillus sp. GCM10027627]|uniref:endospore germination permease n=1 Tax=unclassified Paenibacillus TaxID=185978 RepID=UPI003632FE4B